MQPIEKDKVQELIRQYQDRDLYIHLETTNGAYATHHNEAFFNAGAFIRNAKIRYSTGKITGDGPYRIGLKMEHGWVYGEGLTHYEFDEQGRLLMAGHNPEGKLAIALEISPTPFL